MIDLAINLRKFSFILKNKNKNKNYKSSKKTKEKRERNIISYIGIVFCYQIGNFGFKSCLYQKSIDILN